MADTEHTYAIPDSTIVSLRLLCGSDFSLDFPDAVPFHVTEMGPTTPTDTGRYLFGTLVFLRIHIGDFSELKTTTTVRLNKYTTHFYKIMARFLDEEEEREFLDITSTTDEAQAPQAGAVSGAALPSPPHQLPQEVGTMNVGMVSSRVCWL